MITARNATKIFENVRALDDVSFDIENGSIYGLVGSNGSGKSTLLRLISGVYRTDGGTIGIDGVPTFDNPALKDRIHFLGDTPCFFAQADLRETARFYENLYSGFDRAEFNRLLNIFPLDTRARISSMSKGMQRQAALICALSCRPEILLMDEAFDGLDVVMRRVLQNLVIEGVTRSGMTTVIASHNLRELEDMTDHVGLLHRGKILFNDTSENLRGGLHKIQVAFRNVPDMTVFDRLNVLKAERTGSLLQMVVRGSETEIMSFIGSLGPIFAECIAPSLEEIFIYELEVTGYDVKNILSD